MPKDACYRKVKARYKAKPLARPKAKNQLGRKVVPKKHDAEDVLALVNREFAEATGIRHYRL